MIIGIIHKGSGLGDQLFSYIATRVIALDRGYEFGFVGKEFFKGKFMNLDWGENTEMWKFHIEEPSGKIIVDHWPFSVTALKLFEINKLYYDPEVNFIEDGTIIDGYGAQDERYFGHRLDEIREWLKIDKPPIRVSMGMENKCLINFRGGEFTAFPELFLTPDYWKEAIAMMEKKYPGIEFEVHTDDPQTAAQFFPNTVIITGIEENWKAIRYAKHLIISNSAFAIIPALLGNAKEVIAPRYWARRNIKEWSLPSNYYRKFTYI